MNQQDKQSDVKAKRVVGRKYEHFIAGLYEGWGWEVIRNGDLGIHDGGIDIIATKDGRTRFIQCKYLSPWKRIHENVVSQLYGATHAKADTYDMATVDMYIYSTANLDEDAHVMAEKLGIHFQKTYPMHFSARRHGARYHQSHEQAG